MRASLVKRLQTTRGAVLQVKTIGSCTVLKFIVQAGGPVDGTRIRDLANPMSLPLNPLKP
jgi:hypothetical protein